MRTANITFKPDATTTCVASIPVTCLRTDELENKIKSVMKAEEKHKNGWSRNYINQTNLKKFRRVH